MIDYIRTFTGQKLHHEPSWMEINIYDIAHALSLAPRWGGHSTLPYSVAAHSLYVCAITPEPFKRMALLHDASEAYLADIPSPFKVLLPDYKKLERKIMLAVAQAFGFDWPHEGELPHEHPVKLADADALYMERVHLFGKMPGNEIDVPVFRSPESLVMENNPKTRWDFNYFSSLPAFAVEQLFFKTYENLKQ